MTTKLILGDCLEKMKEIPDHSIDMVLCDPPYGTTACKWDTVIPFEPMWKELKRIVKPNGAIVMTASQPFTSALVMSNPTMFRQALIWEKTLCSNFLCLKKQFAKRNEDIVVFYKKQPTFNPKMAEGKPYTAKAHHFNPKQQNYGIKGKSSEIKNEGGRYPSQIIKVSNEKTKSHPTQKPVALMEYLIRTYTNEGDTVLDFTMGSGTTMVACKNLNRNGIGIELDETYFNIASKRINL